ncbi:MAG: carboxypeptidase-like regulatory domain-containing protein, partial [Muribaculaceae bacterium]|nr:carboxypeptidase-like regulatory domain-containing protein [Muribaculaceae bacterium]
MTVIINAAGYKVSVQVVDSLSNEPIPYAALFIKGTGNGTLTDDNGRAELSTPSPSCLINVSMMGFRPGEYRVSAADTATVIRMIPDGVQLDEVVVKKKGDHYSKRNNPAVALMERVRREAPDSDPDKQPYHSYNNYDKIVLAISNFGTKDSTEGQN